MPLEPTNPIETVLNNSGRDWYSIIWFIEWGFLLTTLL